MPANLSPGRASTARADSVLAGQGVAADAQLLGAARHVSVLVFQHGEQAFAAVRLVTRAQRRKFQRQPLPARSMPR